MAQGSITKHVAKDGTISWRVRADGGTNPATGKRRQVMETFRTRAEAQTWAREQQRRAERGEWVDATAGTLAEWIATWLEGTGKRGRKPTTLRTYACLLGKHVIPALGAVRLGKLSAARLEALMAELEATMAPASAALVYAALRACLADAERLGALAVNPLRRVPSPTVPQTERIHWSADEASRFLAQVGDDPDCALWLVLLLAGLRIGEALALSLDDPDFEAGRLHIRRTLTMGRVGPIALGDSTKGGHSRTVPMPPTLAAALRAQRASALTLRIAHADMWTEHGLLFPGPTGERQHPNPVRRRLAQRCVAAGVPVVTPHALRHTCASLLGERASAAEVRDLLGHHNLSVTNRYLHSDSVRSAVALEALAGDLLAR